MAFGVKTHNMRDCFVTIAGLPINGWADGDAVTIEADGELWTKKVGADGETIRSRSNQFGGKITMNLQQGSLALATILGLKIADLLTGLATVPIMINPIRELSFYGTPQAWLMKEPSITYGRESSEYAFEWDCASLTMTYGPSLAI